MGGANYRTNRGFVHKAVYPINAMGVSKAMMEKVMVAKSRVAIQSREAAPGILRQQCSSQ
jgi:hypothetical protein